jgi:hypothetical protein
VSHYMAIESHRKEFAMMKKFEKQKKRKTP